MPANCSNQTAGDCCKVAMERLSYTAGFEKEYVRKGWSPQLVAQWWKHLAPTIQRT